MTLEKKVYKSYWNKEIHKCDCCETRFYNCTYCGQPKLPEEDHRVCMVYWITLSRIFPEHYRFGPKSYWMPKLRKTDINKLNKMKKSGQVVFPSNPWPFLVAENRGSVSHEH
jgi:hypothetical protein